MEFDLDKYYLKSSSLFDFLPDDERKFVKTRMIRKEYLKNEYLFKERNYPKGVYILRKGKVKIFQTNRGGKQSLVYIYKKGDYFGYRPLLAEEKHPVSAVALDNVVVSFIPRESFLDLFTKSSKFAEKLLLPLSKEFSVWINKMTVFSQYAVKERVALSLLILNKVYQRSDSDLKNIAITLNRDDLASYVGTAKETLIRMLRVFKDEKIITTKGTKITVVKRRALLNMISET